MNNDILLSRQWTYITLVSSYISPAGGAIAAWFVFTLVFYKQTKKNKHEVKHNFGNFNLAPSMGLMREKSRNTSEP